MSLVTDTLASLMTQETAVSTMSDIYSRQEGVMLCQVRAVAEIQMQFTCALLWQYIFFFFKE